MAMNERTTDDLRAMYRDLDKKSHTETFTQDEVAMLLVVCVELGSRGYKLNDDESGWIPKDQPGIWQVEDQS